MLMESNGIYNEWDLMWGNPGCHKTYHLGNSRHTTHKNGDFGGWFMATLCTMFVLHELDLLDFSSDYGYDYN